MSLHIKYIDINVKLYMGLYQKDKNNDGGSERKDYSDLSRSKKTRNKKKVKIIS